MSILDTDQYQLKMVRSLFMEGKTDEEGVFELFFRRLPENHNFLVFAGLDPVLTALQNLTITGPEIAYLKSLEDFQDTPEQFWVWLKNFKFNGEVRSVPEGTIVFPNEPVMSFRGNLLECQLIETLVLSIINYSTAVASRAARLYLAARKKTLAEFGLRRAPGPEAGRLAARAAYIGGFNKTSNVRAGYEYGVPITGTFAHSYVLSHPTEEDAFREYAKTNKIVTALVDTYNIEQGVCNAVTIFGEKLVAVRLDSGDKLVLSRKIRQQLDELGRKDVAILVTDDMNERSLKILALTEAPISGFGVGTYLVNPPALSGVYKLVELEGQPKAKHSENKATFPYEKKITRWRDRANLFMSHDVVKCYNRDVIDATRYTHDLLDSVMLNGHRKFVNIDVSRAEFLEQLQMLPKKYLDLDNTYVYEVVFSEELKESIKETINDYR